MAMIRCRFQKDKLTSYDILPARRWLVALFVFAAILGAQVSPTRAQSKYPSHPIRVMLPFAAGSVSDVALRILADKLAKRLGTSVIIDNQPRAGGVTAVSTVLTSSPDGYTLAILSSSTAISVSLLKQLPYDPVKDFAPVSGISTFANIIASNANTNYRALADVIAAARAKPGALNVGTTTVGSTNHLAATLLQSMAGLTFVIVPFRTPGDLLTALLRNDVDVIVQSYGALKTAVEDKRIRALASTTGTRAAYAPDVPTVDEAGVKGFEVVTWNGVFAPARTPPEVIELLNREIRAVLQNPELKQRFLNLGLEPLSGTPQELGARMSSEINKWARVINDAGIEKQ
jgi:tripartite-type tricarboxylate transporter receptor subunit TctC